MGLRLRWGAGAGWGGGQVKLYTHLRFVKNFEKSLDLANFVNFADLPQGGVGGTTPPLLANPAINNSILSFYYHYLLD